MSQANIRIKFGRNPKATDVTDMAAKIMALGPERVSRHACDPNVLNVFDVAPSSIGNKHAFEAAASADERVSRFLTPPDDPGYHLEIPQKR